MPRKKNKDDRYALNLNKKGERFEGLYKDFIEKQPSKVEKPKDETPGFVKFTRAVNKLFPSYGAGAKYSDEEEQAMAFLGWGLGPEDFYGAYKAITIVGLAAGLVLGGAAYVLLAENLGTLALAPLLLFALAPIVAGFLYKGYPASAVKKETMQSLAYIPEIVNYLTMSMRLTSNLEKAVSFAAAHGQGKIAEDLKKIVWDVQIGRYASIEEGLDDLAYKWGDYNDDFKQALMLIRASILEGNQQRREEILEKASEDVLEGTREKMDMYARGLQQPTVYLYYFGILLPLLLAIVLPIGGSMSGTQLAKPEYLFVGYNLLIPLMVYAFGSNIIAGKPPMNAPPDIPKDYPGLPPTGQAKILGVTMPFKWFAALLLVSLVALGYYTDQGGTQEALNAVLTPVNDLLMAALDEPTGVLFEPSEGFVIPGTLGAVSPLATNRAEEYSSFPHFKFFCETDEKTGKTLDCESEGHYFVGLFTIFGLFIGAALSISLYLQGKYGARKKVQDEIREMEEEFKDAMYVLASRLGENKPVEEALRSATEFLPKSVLAKRVFRRVLLNITTMGMTFDAAVFDKTFGALKDVPSRTIQSGMQFLVDSIELGVNVAAKSLINLSMQMRNSKKINDSLKRLLQDVTTMLSTMATFVAPIVLAVVSAMQRLIIGSLSTAGGGEATESAMETAGTQGFNIGNMFGNAEALKANADPATFAFIMGIYVFEIVILLTYFNSQIEDTNNDLHTYTSIAKSLPLAVILYCVVVYATSLLLGG
ncbi:hypothetical protein COU38_03695 [Candidatus Micrarchaeota archaeon CG10_big_fil_rev_8_21_14_0_10_54_18]|nr:MAG: hypothetical protein AUJ15_01020 [Candidatus Micrarchaeota archaeon CG1_02_55_41]PIO02689.1 MAG: hypothetical protein COT57_02665 [Candidatus Micrarchaeota archaeon CG09_land_8_20_14_0_10_55_25]PJD00950.1 MAG: hypothetical protein COU38_03695 [Candidatus Micrarchaeota archaeon CG10_big_fil_rev_8_21_14_0_10_54_18]